MTTLLSTFLLSTTLVLGGTNTTTISGADDPRDDLRPGLEISCRVRVDADPAARGQMELVHRGGANDLGSYILRIDGPKEGVKFSFFVNVDGHPEPRLSLPFDGKPGVWHDVAAGWDGTNAWLRVDGRTTRRIRRVPGGLRPLPLASAIVYGPLVGALKDLSLSSPLPPPGADVSLRPGTRLGCDVSFVKPPKGETTLLLKPKEYWLRYDSSTEGDGAFNFFIFLDGAWEPRASLRHPVVPGLTYRVSAGWSGLASSIAVGDAARDGAETHGDYAEPTKRRGHCEPTPSPLILAPAKQVKVSRFAIRNEKKALLAFGMFRTRELMPREGERASLIGSLENIGLPQGVLTLEATAKNGATIAPATLAIPALGEGETRPLEWRIDPGTNGMVFLEFAVLSEGKRICRATKRVVFMPKKDPDYSARAWNAPIHPGRTYHIDAAAGDDARDGLTPATAWKTFRNAASLTLGPGERLLLKRGSVFGEELLVSAFGAPGNWAEIGAYGEGMRPQIRRSRLLGERCAHITGGYLAVRDLIVCNAGGGLLVSCPKESDGHVLVERILAHHIEGTYRFNSHGIPEWRDDPGPLGGARSWGIAVKGAQVHHVVMRDCESYQCSSGFAIGGYETFVNRMFCHDNFAHNTSPHPYNTASRSWITDCVFDASGWHASAGTMGIMLAGNDGWIMRGCHFLNQPDSGSPDQGGIDFEAQGENCLVDRCTFRNNAGAAIEVLGLRTPQTRNLEISNCRFDRNNWAFKNGPAEIQVWGGMNSPADVVCSNGRIHGNGYVLVPGVPFYTNNTHTANAWFLSDNRAFDFSEDLDAAFPYPNPPAVSICDEIWIDRPEAALSAKVDDPRAKIAWEQVEGPAGVTFEKGTSPRTRTRFPGEGDYRINCSADNGTLWRTARTAVHVLPPGARTFHAWNFAKNLDAEGWTVENTGTDYEFLPGKISFWNSESFPVHLVCGDFFVIAVRQSGSAAIVTPCDRDVGVDFSDARANTLRIRMQNRTDSKAMRLWWQTDGKPTWDEARSIVFAVEPNDADDRLYCVPLPKAGGIKQLRLAFSADGKPITGTVRIDYIWLGRLPR